MDILELVELQTGNGVSNTFTCRKQKGEQNGKENV